MYRYNKTRALCIKTAYKNMLNTLFMKSETAIQVAALNPRSVDFDTLPHQFFKQGSFLYRSKIKLRMDCNTAWAGI